MASSSASDSSDRPPTAAARLQRGRRDGAHPLPTVRTALGALERPSPNPAAADSLATIKTRLLAHGRRATMADMLRQPLRIVAFDRNSPLADLAYVAQPGLTSRVATRTHLDSTGAHDPIGLSRAPSLLRLASLDRRHGSAYETEDYVEQGGFTPTLRWTVGVALLSAFQFGYNNGNMNTQAAVQRAALGIPAAAGPAADSVWALCVSLSCVGALAGCNVSAPLADRWGRRTFLLRTALVYLLGGLLEAACALPPGPAPTAASPAWARIGLLVGGRALSGIACGGTTVVLPMYLGEVAPAALRGTLGTAFQLTCVVAMTVAQVLGLSGALGSARLWPAVLGGVALPALLQLALGRFLLESPRWHCAVGQLDEAQATLQLLREAGPHDAVLLEELDVMLLATEPVHAAQRPGAPGEAPYRRLEPRASRPGVRQLLVPPTAYPLLLSCGLMALQQLSGINNAFNYSTVFLRANGLGEGTVVKVAILMNVANVLVTLLSVHLMDRAGRRPLLLLSTAGMAASTLLLTAALQMPGRPYSANLSILAILLFVAAFGIGLGPIPWLLPAEILPSETRALASSVAASTNWLANFAASQAFLLIASALGGYAFLPFGAALLLGALFVLKYVPETKGKSLEQIQAELAHG